MKISYLNLHYCEVSDRRIFFLCSKNIQSSFPTTYSFDFSWCQPISWLKYLSSFLEFMTFMFYSYSFFLILLFMFWLLFITCALINTLKNVIHNSSFVYHKNNNKKRNTGCSDYLQVFKIFLSILKCTYY